MRIGIAADANQQTTSIINQKLANFAPKPFIDVMVKHDVLPVIIPILPAQLAAQSVAGLDGLIMPGGYDIAADFLGEEPHAGIGSTYRPRDESEFALLKAALDTQIPVLGVCRGIQVINAVMGGTVYQDLPSEYPGKGLLQHSQKSLGDLPVHHVEIDQDSALGKTLGGECLVNSRHHQAVRNVAPGLRVVAKAPDGVIEAVENDDSSIQAVQWHPENLWQNDPAQERIFTDFFKRVQKRRE